MKTSNAKHEYVYLITYSDSSTETFTCEYLRELAYFVHEKSKGILLITKIELQ